MTAPRGRDASRGRTDGPKRGDVFEARRVEWRLACSNLGCIDLLLFACRKVFFCRAVYRLAVAVRRWMGFCCRVTLIGLCGWSDLGKDKQSRLA